MYSTVAILAQVLLGFLRDYWEHGDYIFHHLQQEGTEYRA